MATAIYKAEPYIISEWTISSDSNGPFCQFLPQYVGPGYVDFTYEPSSSMKTLAKGDKVHALPFLGIYRECSPIAGAFNTKGRLDIGNTALTAQYCGEKAGKSCEWSADVGYYLRAPAAVAPPVPPAGLMLALKQRADTSALADLRKGLFNAPLIIAERKETVNLLRKKGLQIASVVRMRQTKDLKRWLASRKRDKRRVARDIAEEHLALLFGLLPLISEIEGICGALVGDTPFKITGRGRAAETTTLRVDRSSLNAAASITAPAYVAFEDTVTKFSHRTSISCLITMSGAQALREASFNPLATIYDLVPLSFLSDFVSNLGTFIRSLDPLVGVEFLTGSSTSWQERRTTLQARGTFSRWDGPPPANGQPNYRWVRTEGDGTGFARYLRVERSVLTDYPDPSLMFVNNLTLAKVGTIASLAIQRYLKPAQRLFTVKAFRYKGSRPKYLPPINI